MRKSPPRVPDSRVLLRDLMAEHNLSADEVGELARASYSAVRSWLRTPDTPGSRRPPLGLIELAYLRMGHASPIDGKRLSPLRRRKARRTADRSTDSKKQEAA